MRPGLVAFTAPMLVSAVADVLFVDVLALAIAVIGSTITRQSFVRFPWTALLLLVYPVAALDQAASDAPQPWLIPIRHGDSPLLLGLILSVWASGNAFLVWRFHRAHPTAEPASPVRANHST